MGKRNEKMPVLKGMNKEICYLISARHQLICEGEGMGEHQMIC